MPGATFSTKAGLSANPCGYQQITNVSAAVGLTAPARGTTHAALIRPESQSVRWRDDGTNPTAAVGNLLTPTDPPLEYTGDLNAIKFIEVTPSAKLNVSYYNLD